MIRNGEMPMTNLMSAIAQTKISDLIKPKWEGDPVNSHVVEQVTEPKPDYDAMNRMISGVPPANRETADEK